MWPYWLLLLIPAYWAITRQRPMKTAIKQQAKHLPGIWLVVFLLLTMMIGFRHEVGGDWPTYIQHISGMQGTLFSEALTSNDPAYSVLAWSGVQFGAGVYLVNLVCAIFFTSGLIVFCRSQPLPWLALAVAVPYLVTVVAMGYTRQGVAIGIAMLGLVAMSQGNTLRFVLWIGLAAAFHKSAIILVPLAVLASTQRRVFTLIWVFITGLALFVLLLQESVDLLMAGYIEASYQSSGAAIRIAMNALPAAFFLIFRTRFELSPQQRVFWTWMAWSALLFVVMLMLSPSSTAVDRVALYWIPLQLFVWSRLPQAMGRRAGTQLQWLMVVLVYAFAVHLVWLFYADHRMSWLPYKFFPWTWLWS
jgi:hypothetical protein